MPFYDSLGTTYDSLLAEYGAPVGTPGAQFFVTVEVGFADSPASDLTAVTWTDITAYVRLSDGISLTRGRQDETGQVGAGTLVMSLNNRDGRFTPDNTSGAYYPNVKLRRPIRVTVYYDRATFNVWTGYVESWGEGWNNGIQPFVRVQASDIMARLSARTMRALTVEEQAYDDPVLLYPLNDSEGSTTAGDQSDTPRDTLAVTQAGSGGTITFGTSGLLGADPDEGVAVFTRGDATNGKYLQRAYSRLPELAGVSGVTLECFVYIPVSVSGTIRVVELSEAASSNLIALDLVANAPKATLTLGSTQTATSAGALNDGAWHHLAAWYDGASLVLYVDGTAAATSVAAYGTATFDRLTVGATAAGGSLFNGWLSGVAAYALALSAARITAHADGADGATGESSLARFNRIVRLAVGSWAQSASASTPEATMGAQPFAGQSAASLLYQVQDAEIAPVYVGPDGLPAWQARADRQPTLTPTTVDATVVDPSTGFTTSDQLLTNSVTYSRPAGATVTIADATSVADFGKVSDSRTIYYDSDAQLTSAANYIVNTRSLPRLRTGDLTLNLTTIAASVTMSDLLGLDVGSVLRVDNLPRGSGTFVDVFVEGVNDYISTQTWRRTLNTSPLQVGGAVWILGSPIYSVLGSTTILAAG